MKQKFNDGSVLITGNVTRDAEFTDGNYPRCKFSVAVTKADRDAETQYCNVTAWRKNCEIAKKLKKGDTVMVIAFMSNHEYNGKTYEDYTADFIIPLGASFEGSVGAAAQSLGDKFPSDVVEEELDDDLPF